MTLIRPLRPRAVDTLWPAGLFLAVLLVYASSLVYPFFWVDPIDIGLAASRDIPTILTTSQGYLYYRPFAFILWKALDAVSGRFDPFAFHLAQVLTHVVNAWLLYALARRIFQSRWLAGLAALCFAWYPASYQTVTWVIAPQVQATAFALASAIVFYDGRTTNDRRKIGLSLLLLAIALPFHENAVSFGFVIAALDLYLVLNPPSNKPARHLSVWPLAHVALCLAFAVAWFLIPKDPDSAVARFEPAAGWYLLQGLIWPVAGAVGPWRAWFGLDPPAWQPLIFTAPPTLLFLLVAYLRAKRAGLLALGLAWFAVMVLPIWATRGIAYVGISPRIFYVAAPGAALIWVGVLSLALPAPTANRLWRMASAALMAVVLLQSAVFLAARKDVQDKAMPAIWDVVNSGQAAGEAVRLLYINVPDQITPRLREYPVGFFRAILMPVSVELGQYVELHTGIRPETRSLSVPALAQLESYPYQVDMRGQAVDQKTLSSAIRSVHRVFIARYSENGEVRVIEAGGVHPCRGSVRGDACTMPPLAVFGSRLRLVQANIEEASSTQVSLTSVWSCQGEFDSQETLFVHALDAHGQLAAQADGDPLNGLYPLAECRSGEGIRDVRHLTLPPGRYTIHAGIYNRLTGDRLTATDASGGRLTDDAFRIGQVTE